MEDLNKNQIILLCILISFIVSIATGIMTTSLLMQAPVTLTQTVHDVVERTVETVTPTIATASKPQTVQTVVVSEDDSVTNAVAKNQNSIVRIHAVDADGGIDTLYGIGLVLTADGMIASDSKYISTAVNYEALANDGTVIPLVPVAGPDSSVVQFFKAKPTKTYVFTAVILATSDVKLGQAVVVVGGDTTNAVNIGHVSRINTKEDTSTTTPAKYVSSIEADVTPVDDTDGAPLLNLNGEVVGIQLSQFTSSKTYLPSGMIAAEFNQLHIAK